MSASARWRSSSSSGSATPPWRLASCAWARVRFATSRRRARLDQCRATSSTVSPAPISRMLASAGRDGIPPPAAPRPRPPTPGWRRCGFRCARAWRWRRPAGTGDRAVAERARAARRAQACFTWPRICGSPSTSESSPVGDPEQVARGVAVAVGVEIGVQIAAGFRMRRQPVGERAAIVVGVGVELGAVAGGEQRLPHLRQRMQRGQRRRQHSRIERHPFAQVDRRGLVVDAECQQAHPWLIRSGACAKLLRRRPSFYGPACTDARILVPPPFRIARRLRRAAAMGGGRGPGRPDDAMTRTSIGEFALQAGDIDSAARWYLQAARSWATPARRTRDPHRAAGERQPHRRRCARIVARARTADAGHARRRSHARHAPGPDRRGLARDRGAAARSGQGRLAYALGALDTGKNDKRAAQVLGRLLDDDAIPRDLQAWLAFGGFAQRTGTPALAERIVGEVVRRFPTSRAWPAARGAVARGGQDRRSAQGARRGLRCGLLLPDLRLGTAAEYDALGDPVAAAAGDGERPAGRGQLRSARRAAGQGRRQGRARRVVRRAGSAMRPDPTRNAGCCSDRSPNRWIATRKR